MDSWTIEVNSPPSTKICIVDVITPIECVQKRKREKLENAKKNEAQTKKKTHGMQTVIETPRWKPFQAIRIYDCH